MKHILFSLVFLSTAAAAFPGIPDGVYEGQGRMKTAAGLDSVYVARLTLKGNDMEAYYDYGGGKIVTYAATVEPTTSLEFRVLEEKKEIGTGYCDNSLCHLDIPGHHAEESWFLKGNELIRVGAMAHGEVKLVYTETLGLREEKLILECEGFEHSDTKQVRVFRLGATQGTLVEIKKDGQEDKRPVTTEELSKMEFKISPIFEIDRVITFKNGQWWIVYGCGEERPLSCKTSLRD